MRIITTQDTIRKIKQMVVNDGIKSKGGVKMKLTEAQAFRLIHKIERYFKLDIEPEEEANFVMMELINFEI